MQSFFVGGGEICLKTNKLQTPPLPLPLRGGDMNTPSVFKVGISDFFTWTHHFYSRAALFAHWAGCGATVCMSVQVTYSPSKIRGGQGALNYAKFLGGGICLKANKLQTPPQPLPLRGGDVALRVGIPGCEHGPLDPSGKSGRAERQLTSASHVDLRFRLNILGGVCSLSNLGGVCCLSILGGVCHPNCWCFRCFLHFQPT